MHILRCKKLSIVPIGQKLMLQGGFGFFYFIYPHCLECCIQCFQMLLMLASAERELRATTSQQKSSVSSVPKTREKKLLLQKSIVGIPLAT